MTELIPYLETHFRIIRKPYARVLSGGSTGGWESLALELYHPDFFGGTWTLYPDPISFEHYQLVNIYNDDNAFFEPGHTWLRAWRPLMRTAEGQVETTMSDMSRLEAVLWAATGAPRNNWRSGRPSTGRSATTAIPSRCGIR
jgi:enterochelin esterase-like enzyme